MSEITPIAIPIDTECATGESEFGYGGDATSMGTDVIIEVIMTTHTRVTARLPLAHDDVASEAIENLLRKIDFLGYQLSFANQEIDENSFDAIVERECTLDHLSDDELQQKITLLFPYIKNQTRLGADLFSMAFRADFGQLERVLGNIIGDKKSMKTKGFLEGSEHD
jgi:hypothetical protein